MKAGGLQALLACFLKEKKDVFKEFKKHLKNKQEKKDEDSDAEKEEEVKENHKKLVG